MDLATLILIAVRISVFLSVLAMGFETTWQDATYLFRNRRELLRAILSLDVIMPLVAVVFVLLLNLQPVVKLALVALSVSPIPPILPRKEFKAGGNRAYTVGLLVFAAALSIVFVPLSMVILRLALDERLNMPVLPVAELALLTVLAPMLLGLAIRRLAPEFAGRVARPLAIVATILLIVTVLPIVIFQGKAILSLIGDGTLIAMAAFVLVGLIAGHFLGGPVRENRTVLALSTATRHPGIAIAIAHANFPQQKLAIPAIGLYLIVNAIATLPYMVWTKRQRAAHPEVGAGLHAKI
jgi:bile acid:Na+ symporter, BASS family